MSSRIFPINDQEAHRASTGEQGDTLHSVLIVEDDAVFAYSIARYLEAQGLKTHVELSSMAGLETFARNSIQVVVADVMLRKGEPHGLSLVRMIHDKDPGVGVVLMTAFPDALDGEGRLPGRLFHKPFELSDLCKEIKDCIGRGAKMAL